MIEVKRFRKLLVSLIVALVFWICLLLILNRLTTLIYQKPMAEPVDRQLTAAEPARPKHDLSTSKDTTVIQHNVSADITRGRKIFTRCAVCHSPVKGGANRVGPPLWNIVSRRAATNPNFRYSNAMRAFGDSGGSWDDETLDQYLKAPQTFVRGTAMAFAGIKDDRDRADLISYLHSLSDNAVNK